MTDFERQQQHSHHIWGYNPLSECFTWFKRNLNNLNQSDISIDIAALTIMLSVNESSTVRQQNSITKTCKLVNRNKPDEM